MKAEIVALAMLRASQRVQKIVLDLLGSKLVSFDFNPFLYLAHPNAVRDLADIFQCRPEAGFAKLVETIQQEVSEKRPSPRFTKKHLQKLTENRQTIRNLADILHCEENQIYDILFDIPAILQFIYGFDPQTVKKWLFTNLQNDVNLCPGYTVIRYLAATHIARVSDDEWGPLFDDNVWLRAPALARLRGVLVEGGYHDASDSKVLATIVDEANYFDAADAAHLDALAILHIKRQVAWIVRQMTDQAVELANAALQVSRNAAPFVHLKNHIEFYEQKHPASAWRSLLRRNEIDNAESLRSLQAKFPNVVFTSTGARGIPQRRASLILRQESVTTGFSLLKLWKTTKTIVIVSCKVMDQPEALDVLRCSTENSQEAEALTQLFAKVKFTDVQNEPEIDIGEFLVSQGKPLELHEKARLVLSKLQPQVIRSLILAGLDIPGSVIFIWDKALNYEIPIQPLENADDTCFPLKRNQILQDIQKNYQSLNLQIIDKLNSAQRGFSTPPSF